MTRSAYEARMARERRRACLLGYLYLLLYGVVLFAIMGTLITACVLAFGGR